MPGAKMRGLQSSGQERRLRKPGEEGPRRGERGKRGRGRGGGERARGGARSGERREAAGVGAWNASHVCEACHRLKMKWCVSFVCVFDYQQEILRPTNPPSLPPFPALLFLTQQRRVPLRPVSMTRKGKKGGKEGGRNPEKRR
jgi:hypothetical protein